MTRQNSALPARAGGQGICRDAAHLGDGTAMRAAFPVTLRIVGEPFFHRMTRDFLAALPPRGRRTTLGLAFPAFVGGYGPAAGLPFLSDIARLEAACSHARHAAEAAPLDPNALCGVPEGRLDDVVLTPLPSLRFVASGYPVAAIWHAHQPEHAEPEPIRHDAGGETVVVWRSADAVRVRAVGNGAFTFMMALAIGQPLGTARAGALALAPDFPFAAELRALLAGGCFGAARLPSAE